MFRPIHHPQGCQGESRRRFCLGRQSHSRKVGVDPGRHLRSLFFSRSRVPTGTRLARLPAEPLICSVQLTNCRRLNVGTWFHGVSACGVFVRLLCFAVLLIGPPLLKQAASAFQKTVQGVIHADSRPAAHEYQSSVCSEPVPDPVERSPQAG